ncbi:MAG: MCE family protein [Nitrospirae bacterium]|nr:MCE family protein [Nitrospirota bacterium]
MFEGPRGPDLADIPSAVAQPKRKSSPQLIWLIPIVAVLIGGWLAVKTILEQGPTITITFKTAEGIEAGKTKVKYKNIDIGEVKSVGFSKDLENIVLTVEMSKGAAPHLVEDVRFWIVKPRISGGQVSGIGTLFSGSYIEMDRGKSSTRREHFEGLEFQPAVTGEMQGRQFVLHGKDLGSHDVGTPVMFRRIQVGKVAVNELNQDGSGVTLKIFVESPYDKFVNSNTRFWDVSGIDITADAEGVKVNTEGLMAILLGGVAFEAPAGSEALPQADPDTVFPLFPDRTAAMKQPERETLVFTMYFEESLRGLTVGAPVELNGVTIGEVKNILTGWDSQSVRFRFPVDVAIFPGRLRALSREKMADPTPAEQKARIDRIVEAGLRAQMKTGSLLTGQMYVSLGMFPDAAPAKINWATSPPEFPTHPGMMVELQTTLMNLSKKLENMPIDKISGDLRTTLQSLNRTLVGAEQMVKRMDKEVAPAAKSALEDARRLLITTEQTLASDSPLQQDLRTSLRDLSRAAQSLRELTELLERQPESLIRGKKESKR